MYERLHHITYKTHIHDCHEFDGLPERCSCVLIVVMPIVAMASTGRLTWHLSQDCANNLERMQKH